MSKYVCIVIVVIASLLGMSGCTVHPPGERQERDLATREGEPFQKPAAQRVQPPLSAQPSPEELVRYALLSNPGLEQRYWEWRSAIEQIPQDGTQPTNLVLFAGVPITNGSTAFDRTTVTVANDPMNDILWPTKLTTAARRALENARAAGKRFQKARYELRSKVLAAYDDYALTAELIRLEESNAALLQTTVTATEARYRAGASSQKDYLKARNELDLSHNEIAKMQSELRIQRAALNSLLGRQTEADIAIPKELPPRQEIRYSDEQLLNLAAQQNPELKALADEIRGREDGIKLARLQYFPDFSASAATDLAGSAQTLMGMITVPILRYQAINAAIAQAQANLRVTEAMRRQASNDLAAQVILDISSARDADRQLQLFEQTILPRAQSAVDLARSAYETSHATLLDLLESQRSRIALRQLTAKLRVEREKNLASLEAAAGISIVSEKR